MGRILFALFAPPVAIWRFATAKATAGPIAVFWLTSIVGVFYGLTGGPTVSDGASWPTVGLAVFLWLASAVWAMLVLSGTDQDQRHTPESTISHQVDPELYTDDPFKEVRR